jgi:sirohydrochlorin ferrochelatase
LSSMIAHPQHTVGLVIVDHGSKKDAANEMLLDMCAIFRRVSQCPIVEAAHMELAEPTIAQAFDRCVAQGATMVVVHPYFLAPGRHSTTDIPRMAGEAAAKHPGVRFHVTQPLGLDEKIAQLMSLRIGHCVANDFSCDYCRGTGCCDMAAGEAVAR